MQVTPRSGPTARAGSRSDRRRSRGSIRPASSSLRRRLAATVLLVVASVAVAHPSAALIPSPPMPVRLPIAEIGRMILTLAEDYVDPPMRTERGVHNEMQLTLNTRHAAI